MDPVSQGVIGAAYAAGWRGRSSLRIGLLIGALGGMAPDLDILIRSSTDPMMALEYHRQFTHGLAFIPIGGFIVGLACYWVFAKRLGLSLQATIGFATIGYATHGLLDACTTYGTQLFYPFSTLRVAWHNLAIVDPFMTLPPLVLVTVAAFKRQRSWLAIAVVWSLIYPSVGVLQRNRAITVGEQLAQQRGHWPVEVSANPTLGANVLWKLIYAHQGRYYVDGVWVSWSSKTETYLGTSIKVFDQVRDMPWLDLDSQQAKDLEKFRWFSDGYLGLDPNNPNQVFDMRYSMLPNTINGLWSVELNPAASPSDHVRYLVHRSRDETVYKRYWQMLWGKPANAGGRLSDENAVNTTHPRQN